MKRKVAIRKLNRTLLKKEGTKEIYITNVKLLSFFGYTSMEQLATARNDERANKQFKVINEQGEQLPDLVLRVTKENNEVRLTGFGDFFDNNNISETGSIILECLETNGSKEYMLSFCRNTNIRVFKAYEPADSYANYQVNGNRGGRTSFSELEVPTERYDNTYWLWDDTFNNARWTELLSKELNVVCMLNNRIEYKTIRIESLDVSFQKLLKARSTSNHVRFQDKDLYTIEELIEGEWVIADLNRVRLIEFIDENDRIVLKNRDDSTFQYYEGESIE